MEFGVCISVVCLWICDDDNSERWRNKEWLSSKIMLKVQKSKRGMFLGYCLLKSAYFGVFGSGSFWFVEILVPFDRATS